MSLFYNNIKENKSMSFIPYDNSMFSSSPAEIENTVETYETQYNYKGVSHYTPLKNSNRTADEFSTKLPVTDLNIAPLWGADSKLHRYKYKPFIFTPFHIENISKVYKKPKNKNVSWNNELLIGFTYSICEYDRKIDNLQIKQNLQELRKISLMFSNLKRKLSSSELCHLSTEDDV